MTAAVIDSHTSEMRICRLCSERHLQRLQTGADWRHRKDTMMRLTTMVATWLLMISSVGVGCGSGPQGTATADQAVLTAATTIAPTSGFGDPTTSTTLDAQGNVNWVGGAWRVPLPVSAGDVIGTVTVIVRDNGPGNGTSSLDYNNVLVNLISRTSTGDTSRGFIASNASGTRQMLTFTPTGGQYVVQAGDEMLVAFSGLKGGALPGPSTVSSMTGVVTVSPFQSPPPSPPLPKLLPIVSLQTVFTGADVDNLDIGNAAIIIFRTDATSPILDGMTGGVDGRVVTLIADVLGSPLGFTALDGGSLPENQLLFPTPAGGPTFLQITRRYQSFTFVYDGAIAKWRLIGQNF